MVRESILYDESTNEAVRAALPESVATALELSTHLGDGAVLVVLGTLLYWFGDERNRSARAFVVAIGIAALALSAGLKGIFQVPRPSLAFAPPDYGGYSFPSAHALGAAAFYSAVAAISKTGTRRDRYAIAGLLIGVVALSRVVLGVHYVADVVVGVALGIALVAVGLRFGTGAPGAVFGLAAVIAVVAFALGSREFTTLTIGASMGGYVGWTVVRDRSAAPTAAAMLILGVFCLPVFITLRGVTALVDLPGVVELVGYATATAAVLVVPVVADRLNDWRPVVWLQQRLPVEGRRVKLPDVVGSERR